MKEIGFDKQRRYVFYKHQNMNKMWILYELKGKSMSKKIKLDLSKLPEEERKNFEKLLKSYKKN